MACKGIIGGSSRNTDGELASKENPALWLSPNHKEGSSFQMPREVGRQSRWHGCQVPLWKTGKLELLCLRNDIKITFPRWPTLPLRSPFLECCVFWNGKPERSLWAQIPSSKAHSSIIVGFQIYVLSCPVQSSTFLDKGWLKPTVSSMLSCLLDLQREP